MNGSRKTVLEELEEESWKPSILTTSNYKPSYPYGEDYGKKSTPYIGDTFVERDAQTTLTYYYGKSPNGTSIYCSTGINTFVDLD